jgi:ATP-dependent helicase/DNAse subunit B
MTSIHYLAAGNVDARQRLLDAKLSSWKDGPVLHLVPTSGRVIELESDHRFWLKRKQDTLTGLIHRIFEENTRFRKFAGFRPVDDGVRSLIVKKAIEKRMSQPEGLLYFYRLLTDHEINFPGIFRAVSSFFSQLVRNNYQDRFAADLGGKIMRAEEKGSPQPEETYALESDLVWLFGDYEEIKKELMVYDEDDVLSSVRDLLAREESPYPIKDIGAIIFDGFIHLSVIEEQILHHLFKKVKEVWWTLDFNGASADPAGDFKSSCGINHDGADGKDVEAYRIFRPMAEFMERLEAGGFETVVEKTPDALFLNPAAEGLYLDGTLRETAGSSLRIKYFMTRSQEIKGIAREIKRIIHEDGLDVSKDLGRIRIIFPDLNAYAALISEVFREYGIPLSLTRGLSLFSHPFSNILLLMLKLPLDHYKREDVFRLFSSELIGKRMSALPSFDSEQALGRVKDCLLPEDDIKCVETLTGKLTAKGPGALDIDFIDRIAQTCGIKDFSSDFTGHDNGADAVRDYYREKSAKITDVAEQDALRREYYRFIIQRSMLADALRPFKSLAGQDNPGGIEKALPEVLSIFGFPGNIAETAVTSTLPDRTYNRKSLRRDLNAWSMLKTLVSASSAELTIESRLFHIRPGHELLSAFQRIFRERIEKAYLMDEQDPNVIRVSQWLEIRGRSFDYIFAGGLTDRDFPLKEQGSFILPEPSKSIFRVPDAMDMSRRLFSHLLRNYRKSLYLSCPLNTDEKEVRPSNVFADMETMMPGDSAGIEEAFKWEENHYISSDHEMLDSSISKGDSREPSPETAFSLNNIIINDPNLLEGIVRGLKAMGSRWALNGLFEYDGITANAGKFLAFQGARKDIFSASQLDSLANCPMRYLFERVYGLKRMEALAPDASPVALGDHIHRILSAFFRRLKDQGKNVAGLGIDRAFSLAHETADAYFKANPFVERIEFFYHQKNEFLQGLDNSSASVSGQSAREGIFALLLRFEEKKFRDSIPEGIEYEFGFGDDEPPSLGKVKLRGLIDRFDRDKNDHERYFLYDYKTGSLPATTLIKQGLSFQLPVYIKAMKKGLNAGKVTASLYSLKREALMKEDPMAQDLCDRAREAGGLDLTGVAALDHYANNLMEVLDSGRFHHSAEMVKCGYCDFRYACHRNERRMDHLVQSQKDHGIYSGARNLGIWKQVDDFRKERKKIAESMQKAFSLKREPDRRRHYEAVLEYESRVLDSRYSLPFHDDYIDELLGEIEGFKTSWKAGKPGG